MGLLNKLQIKCVLLFKKKAKSRILLYKCMLCTVILLLNL
uniref:Uncharacterized protein n=1 Tax=Anguilla anguilla TaxID=7936 RepID=A0A0E9WQA5_ANGAN